MAWQKNKQQNQRNWKKKLKLFWGEDWKRIRSGTGLLTETLATGQDRFLWSSHLLSFGHDHAWLPLTGYPLPIPALQSPLPTPGGTTELQWGWKNQTQDTEKQHWKNSTWCSGAVKTFMHYGVVFHEPATTASNKPGIHRVEWPLSINSLRWQRLHFPWGDSFFQNLGSIDLASIWLTARLWAMMDVSPLQHNRNSQIAKKHRVNRILSLFTCQAINYLES